jgi:hypothetical protein
LKLGIYDGQAHKLVAETWAQIKLGEDHITSWHNLTSEGTPTGQIKLDQQQGSMQAAQASQQLRRKPVNWTKEKHAHVYNFWNTPQQNQEVKLRPNGFKYERRNALVLDDALNQPHTMQVLIPHRPSEPSSALLDIPYANIDTLLGRGLSPTEWIHILEGQGFISPLGFGLEEAIQSREWAFFKEEIESLISSRAPSDDAEKNGQAVERRT